VTVAGVAERAGVSTTTVSLILSERQEYLRQFHPDTIKRVRETARRLGYHGNLFASGLPTKESPFFALIVREECASESSTWHQWAFEGDMLAGIIHASSEARIFPIVAQSDSTLTPDTLRPLERVIAGGPFGAIVRTPHPLLEKYVRTRIRMGQAMIVVFPQRISKWPTNAIDVDNVAVGKTAGRLLAGHGRRRWGVVTYKPLREAHAQRIEGFKQIAEKVDAHVDTIQLSLGMDDLKARDFLSPRLKKLKLDGIFSLDSVSSVGVLLACLRLGLQPQVDFHQVGCDCSLWQSTPLPRITAVDISWKEVGVRAVRRLVEASQKSEKAFDTILLPPRVIAADTCPIPDSMVETETSTDKAVEPQQA
jgi:LacI family transcriptional regulator